MSVELESESVEVIKNAVRLSSMSAKGLAEAADLQPSALSAALAGRRTLPEQKLKVLFDELKACLSRDSKGAAPAKVQALDGVLELLRRVERVLFLSADLQLPSVIPGDVVPHDHVSLIRWAPHFMIGKPLNKSWHHFYCGPGLGASTHAGMVKSVAQENGQIVALVTTDAETECLTTAPLILSGLLSAASELHPDVLSAPISPIRSSQDFVAKIAQWRDDLFQTGGHSGLMIIVDRLDRFMELDLDYVEVMPKLGTAFKEASKLDGVTIVTYAGPFTNPYALDESGAYSKIFLQSQLSAISTMQADDIIALSASDAGKGIGHSEAQKIELDYCGSPYVTSIYFHAKRVLNSASTAEKYVRALIAGNIDEIQAFMQEFGTGFPDQKVVYRNFEHHVRGLRLEIKRAEILLGIDSAGKDLSRVCRDINNDQSLNKRTGAASFLRNVGLLNPEYDFGVMGPLVMRCLGENNDG